MSENKEINTMNNGTPEWLARYNDGSVLWKIDPESGKESFFNDIDQSKLDIFEIWMRKDGRIYPVFAFRFHPEIMRLICFNRTYQNFELGSAIKNSSIKMFFGYQMTIGAVRKKNYQVVWSVRSDGQLTVEKGTGRSPELSLNPGEKK